MHILRLVPLALSSLVLAAHFLRSGALVFVVIALVMPFVLLIRSPHALWVVRGYLVAAALEWIRTMASLYQLRHALGQPWLRMVLILGGVALFTLMSALPLRSRVTSSTNA